MPSRLCSVCRLALVAAVLGGCAASRPERTEDGRIVLRYWEKWTGFEGAAMREIVDAYNRQSREYFVEYIEGGASMDQKLLIAIAGGNPPDIAGFWSDRLAGYVQNGALEPLDALMAASGVSPEAYLPKVLEACQFEGFTWGLPLTPATLALFYNRDHFRRAGLDPDRPPRTIAELDEFARRLTLWDGAHEHITQLGFTPDIPGWWNNLWPIWFGGEMWDGQGRVTVDSPENIAAMQWVQSYAREYSVEELDRFKAAANNFDSPQWPFFSGRLSMVLQGTWMTNFLASHAPELDWGVAPFPAVREDMNPISFMQVDMLVLPRDCPHPAGAWDFMLFTQRPENLEALNIAHHKFSPLREVSPSFHGRHPNHQVGLFQRLADAPGTHIVPPIAAFNEMQAEMWVVFYQVLKTGADPAACLATARDAMQRMLDRSLRLWNRVRAARIEQWSTLP